MEIFLNNMYEDNATMENNVIHLDYSSKLAGVASTVFHTMRKMKRNAQQPMLVKTATIGNKTHTSSVLIKGVQDSSGFVDFDYMIATPILDMMTAFKLSWDEATLGSCQFTLKNYDTENNEMRKLASVGLNNSHIPFLGGITYKPERRSGLIRSQGPLTQAILLLLKEIMIEFSGENDVKTWITQFKNINRTYNPDVNTMRTLLVSKLKGKAQQWLKQLPNYVAEDPMQILQALEVNFAFGSSKLQQRQTFEERKWVPSESFAQNCNDKAVLANSLNIQEEELVEYIVAAQLFLIRMCVASIAM